MRSTPLTRATYEARIQTRDGRVIRGCRFNRGVGSFNRVLDGVSAAELTVPATDCDCSCVIDFRNTELAFYRDDCEEPAWVGPIVRMVDDPTQGTIRFAAVDRLYWWEGAEAIRAISRLVPNEIDVVDYLWELIGQAEEFFPSLIQYGFRNDNTLRPPPSELLIEAELAVGESLFSQFLTLAKTVLDFTMVGPHLYWGSPEIAIEDGANLNGLHWTKPPVIDRDLSSIATQVRVTGSGGVVGLYPAENIDTGNGKRSLFINDTNLNTQAEVDARAFEVFEQNSTATNFIITGDGSLSELFPGDPNGCGRLSGLIPGRNYLVSASAACLESGDELLQLFNVVVEIGDESNTGRLVEKRVAGDFQRPGSEGSAERISG